MSRPKPVPPTRADIDADISASLTALGIRQDSAARSASSSRDRILAAYAEVIRKTGRLVTAVEVGDHVGLCNARVSLVARQLAKEGRMLRLVDRTTGKTVYVPKVT